MKKYQIMVTTEQAEQIAKYNTIWAGTVCPGCNSNENLHLCQHCDWLHCSECKTRVRKVPHSIASTVKAFDRCLDGILQHVGTNGIDGIEVMS